MVPFGRGVLPRVPFGTMVRAKLVTSQASGEWVQTQCGWLLASASFGGTDPPLMLQEFCPVVEADFPPMALARELQINGVTGSSQEIMLSLFLLVGCHHSNLPLQTKVQLLQIFMTMFIVQCSLVYFSFLMKSERLYFTTKYDSTPFLSSGLQMIRPTDVPPRYACLFP